MLLPILKKLKKFPCYVFSILVLNYLSINTTYAAIDPVIQQRMDIGTAVSFIQKHPLVLDGLKSIKANKHDKVSIIYEYQNLRGEIKLCEAKFSPTLMSLFLPKKSVSFSKSNCPIDYRP